MSVAAFLGFSASFVPFTIVVAAIAISVVQRNIRAPVMFAGIIISALLLSAFLQALYGFLEGRAGGGGGGGAGGGVLLEALRDVATQGNGGCDTLILPYISSGMIPRANAFFMAWVTAYLAWSQSQWDHKGGTPVNPFVWTGIALAWGLIAYSWRNEYPSDTGPQSCGNFWPGGVISLVSGTILGLGYGALIGAIQPTALYFAPLASDNVVCTAPRRQVFSCTIGSGTPPS